MCELWVPMLPIHVMPPGPQLDARLTLALPGPKGMRLCVIMSPSSGYFPVSPLFLNNPLLVSLPVFKGDSVSRSSGRCWLGGAVLGRVRQRRGESGRLWRVGKVLPQITIHLLPAREEKEAEKPEHLERGEEGRCFK